MAPTADCQLTCTKQVSPATESQTRAVAKNRLEMANC